MPEFEMTRSQFLRTVGAAGIGLAAVAAARPASARAAAAPDRDQWLEVVGHIRSWWDHFDGNTSTTSDLRSADEAAIRADTAGTLLFEPFPFATPTGSTNGVYGDLYGWDTFFINVGMLELGLHEQVRAQILDQLSLIERYGKVLNGNRSYYLTRGQPPLLAESVARYYRATGDQAVLQQAYPLLVEEFTGWWEGTGHRTDTGLSSNYDSGDPGLPPQLAAEAETGLDWTPIFAGDVRRCVPLLTNACLIRYADVLSELAAAVGAPSEIRKWQAEARRRRAAVDRLCYDSGQRLYVEYDFVAGKQLPYVSACTLWPLWAQVTSPSRGAAIAATALAKLEFSGGLATTDRIYPSPHPDYPGWLQWEYPAGWAPLHIVGVEALETYGMHAAAERVASKFLNLMLAQYTATGELWEKYNVVDANLTLPSAAHAGNRPMHGWTSAAVVLLGKRIFGPPPQ